jgi:hypothetical protein
VGQSNPEGSPLPGDENGKISCLTCHDPHPQGVIKGRTVYEARYSDRDKNFVKEIGIPEREEKIKKGIFSLPKKTQLRLRLPLEGDKLCKTCHTELN